MMRRPQTPYQMKKSAAAWASQVNHNQHLESEVQQADAHQLITLLYKATLSHLEDAQRGCTRLDAASRAKWLNKAQACISELRISLRHDLDAEFAATLDSLYDYAGRQLGNAKIQAATQAGFEKTQALVSEVIELLRPVAEAWQEVHPEAIKFREDLAEYQKNQAAKPPQQDANE